MNINEFKKNYFPAPTQEIFNSLAEYYEANGSKNKLDPSIWHTYKEKTAFSLANAWQGYCYVKWYKDNNWIETSSPFNNLNYEIY